MPEETVTISKQEYDSLRERSKILRALENNGVDNWEWYGDAMASLEGDSNEDRT